MAWIGMAMVWAGYSVGLYGYSLVRGYNLTFPKMLSPTGWYSGPWPPQKAGNTEIIPTGDKAGTIVLANTLSNAPAGEATTATGGIVPGQPAGGIGNTAAIKAAAAVHGWGTGGQWNALTHLLAAESGGSSTVANPSSGALGIAQALGHGTGCSAGSLGNEYGPQYGLSCAQAQQANSGNAFQQARWMMGYIASRYGTPANAWSHETNYHWY